MAEADGNSVKRVLVNINQAAEKDKREHPSKWA
jgi:hypothetical protein